MINQTPIYIHTQIYVFVIYIYTYIYIYILYIYIYLFYFTKKNLKSKRNMDLRPLYTFTSNDLGNN